jgi:hypothetical protein
MFNFISDGGEIERAPIPAGGLIQTTHR